MFKKSIAFVVALVLWALLFPLHAQAADIPARFEFRGAGNGHGVGMSQFGAYGQALEGKSASEIATYYYPGTTVEAVDDSQLIRVNIADKVTSVGFSVESPSGAPAPLNIYAGDLLPEVPATETPILQMSQGSELVLMLTT